MIDQYGDKGEKEKYITPFEKRKYIWFAILRNNAIVGILWQEILYLPIIFFILT